MDYDFEYYTGKDLIYPKTPSRPRLSVKPTATEARDYATAMDISETNMKEYTAHCKLYRDQISARMTEFQDRVRTDYDITQAQFDILWYKSYDVGHNCGLQEVLIHFDEFYQLAVDFAKNGRHRP